VGWRKKEEHRERMYSVGGSLASSTTRLVPGVPAGTRRDEFPLRDNHRYFGHVKQTNV